MGCGASAAATPLAAATAAVDGKADEAASPTVPLALATSVPVPDTATSASPLTPRETRQARKHLKTVVKLTLRLAQMHETLAQEGNGQTAPDSQHNTTRSAWDSGDAVEEASAAEALFAPVIEQLRGRVDTNGDAAGGSNQHTGEHEREEALDLLHLFLTTSALTRARDKLMFNVKATRKSRALLNREHSIKSHTEAQRVAALFRTVQDLDAKSMESVAAELWTLTMHAEDKLSVALAGAIPAVVIVMKEGTARSKERSA